MWMLVAVAVAVAVAGCGGSGDAAGGPPLSRPQLMAQAEAICRRRNVAIDAIKLRGTSAADIARFASRSVAVEQAAFTDLARLTPPASMAGDWRQVLAYSRVLLRYVVELDEFGRRGEVRAISVLARSAEAAKRQLLVVGTRGGFRYCARVR